MSLNLKLLKDTLNEVMGNPSLESAKINNMVSDALYGKRPLKPYVGGNAPNIPSPKGKTRLVRDTSVCDVCLSPATELRDETIMVVDEYGYCDKHAKMYDEYDKAFDEFIERDILKYDTDINAALTVLPDGWVWTLTAVGARVEKSISMGGWRDEAVSVTEFHYLNTKFIRALVVVGLEARIFELENSA